MKESRGEAQYFMRGANNLVGFYEMSGGATLSVFFSVYLVRSVLITSVCEFFSDFSTVFIISETFGWGLRGLGQLTQLAN